MFSVSGISAELLLIVFSLAAALLIAAFTISVINSVKLRKIMKNCSSGRLDESITLYYNKIEALSNELNEKSAEFGRLEKMINAGAQKFALVRYDAFDDISNNLSFSLAVLDGDNSGFVLTSIYGRDTSSMYIKPIIKGKSRYTMSDEEVNAYEKAIDSYEDKMKQ